MPKGKNDLGNTNSNSVDTKNESANLQPIFIVHEEVNGIDKILKEISEESDWYVTPSQIINRDIYFSFADGRTNLDLYMKKLTGGKTGNFFGILCSVNVDLSKRMTSNHKTIINDNERRKIDLKHVFPLRMQNPPKFDFHSAEKAEEFIALKKEIIKCIQIFIDKKQKRNIKNNPKYQIAKKMMNILKELYPLIRLNEDFLKDFFEIADVTNPKGIEKTSEKSKKTVEKKLSTTSRESGGLFKKLLAYSERDRDLDLEMRADADRDYYTSSEIRKETETAISVSTTTVIGPEPMNTNQNENNSNNNAQVGNPSEAKNNQGEIKHSLQIGSYNTIATLLSSSGKTEDSCYEPMIAVPPPTRESESDYTCLPASPQRRIGGIEANNDYLGLPAFDKNNNFSMFQSDDSRQVLREPNNATADYILEGDEDGYQPMPVN